MTKTRNSQNAESSALDEWMREHYNYIHKALSEMRPWFDADKVIETHKNVADPLIIGCILADAWNNGVDMSLVADFITNLNFNSDSTELNEMREYFDVNRFIEDHKNVADPMISKRILEDAWKNNNYEFGEMDSYIGRIFCCSFATVTKYRTTKFWNEISEQEKHIYKIDN